MPQLTSIAKLAISFVLLTACSDAPDPVAAIGSDPGSLSSSALSPDAGAFGIGDLVRAPSSSACTAPEYRQFDFWVGKWDVLTPGGAPAGTNSITRKLGGCLIEESWTSAAGNRGRSLNFYDAATDSWYQTWVDQNGLNLRLNGGFVTGAMMLGGPRGAALDRVSWSVIAPSVVRQFWEQSTDGGTTYTTVFDGHYHARSQITPAQEVPGSSCTAAGYRDLDFWIGEWDVRAEHGPVIGQSTVRADLSGCLIEEQLDGVHGYRMRSFVSFGRGAARWFRTSIDTDGRRVQASGPRVANAVSVSGVRSRPGANDPLVRIVIRPGATASEVRQTWEVSRDGGTTWKLEMELVYTRR